MARNNLSIGVILIGVAVLLLLGKLGLFSLIGVLFWPMFLLIPGILFHVLYFARILPSAFLIPGGILVTYSLLFFYCNIFGWDAMRFLWPVFILGVAAGLYVFHFFERQAPRSVQTAAIVLAIISGVCLAIASVVTAGIYFIVLLLIIFGASLIINSKRR